MCPAAGRAARGRTDRLPPRGGARAGAGRRRPLRRRHQAHRVRHPAHLREGPRRPRLRLRLRLRGGQPVRHGLVGAHPARRAVAPLRRGGDVGRRRRPGLQPGQRRVPQERPRVGRAAPGARPPGAPRPRCRGAGARGRLRGRVQPLPERDGRGRVARPGLPGQGLGRPHHRHGRLDEPARPRPPGRKLLVQGGHRRLRAGGRGDEAAGQEEEGERPRQQRLRPRARGHPRRPRHAAGRPPLPVERQPPLLPGPPDHPGRARRVGRQPVRHPPMVQIGHNASVAWTHTVSHAQRFTLYRLKLVPGWRTTYLVDG
ncbi:penicillin acylase family protein [Nonomuraea ferruginea]